MTTLIIIQLILALALVILVLLQGSDNEGLGLGGGTFGGMMSARGSANLLSRLTALSPEVPPRTTKTFFIFFLFTYNFNL